MSVEANIKPAHLVYSPNTEYADWEKCGIYWRTLGRPLHGRDKERWTMEILWHPPSDACIAISRFRSPIFRSSRWPEAHIKDLLNRFIGQVQTMFPDYPPFDTDQINAEELPHAMADTFGPGCFYRTRINCYPTQITNPIWYNVSFAYMPIGPRTCSQLRHIASAPAPEHQSPGDLEILSALFTFPPDQVVIELDFPLFRYYLSRLTHTVTPVKLSTS
jgi:hypothetical protein